MAMSSTPRNGRTATPGHRVGGMLPTAGTRGGSHGEVNPRWGWKNHRGSGGELLGRGDRGAVGGRGALQATQG